ncbi:two-component system response regulator [Helicobacter sp. 12S02232-10]|uniref:response regulator transcription factor n=1 Tax=Helicobacter sp. 12S02232-10 TaxID=1476197 RepID=UPI000BA61935|nr:response regulator transcription factor [Helicobacter sp. 12S02232-10]PAF48306.1 two-component system response regulator [Helicobacter sp. 12S02232-10]
MKTKILLLEDDILLHKIVKEFLIELGFEVTSAFDGQNAENILLKESFNLWIFDVHVPKIIGFEILQNLRKLHIQTPVIFITALKDSLSLKKAFEIGANDYIKKPFDLEELQARIEHILKSKKIQIAPECFYEEGILSLKGKEMPLKQKEIKLLEFFLHNKGRVISKEELLNNIWSYEQIIDESTLRTYIKNLRKYLGKEIIQNIKGVGYCFKQL